MRILKQGYAEKRSEIVTTYGAYTDSVERVLGAAHPFLYRPYAAAVKEWLTVDEVEQQADT